MRLCQRGFTGIRTCARLQKRCVLPDRRGCTAGLAGRHRRTGILPLADYLCRENDVRLSLRAAVVRDGSAAELLENDNEVYALSELLDRSAQDGVLPDMPLYRVTDVLHADGTAILPTLRVDAFGQMAPAGTAVFKNERLNCFLDGEIGGGAYA